MRVHHPRAKAALTLRWIKGEKGDFLILYMVRCEMFTISAKNDVGRTRIGFCPKDRLYKLVYMMSLSGGKVPSFHSLDADDADNADKL